MATTTHATASASSRPGGELPLIGGLLAGDARRVLHASVRCGPLPSQAPPALASVAEAVTDAAGRVVEWRLGRDVGEEQALAFVHWRHGFVVERVLGDLGTVRSFLQWAGPRLDASAMHVLKLGDCTIAEPAAVGRLELQARRATELLRSTDETGLGLCTPRTRGVVRGFPVGDAPVPLLVTSSASVSAVADGVHLDADDLHLVVTAWRWDGDGLSARTGDGAEIELGAGTGARLLRMLAPGTAAVEVRPTPLSRVFAPLLTFLVDVAHAAAAARAPLQVRAV